MVLILSQFTTSHPTYLRFILIVSGDRVSRDGVWIGDYTLHMTITHTDLCPTVDVLQSSQVGGHLTQTFHSPNCCLKTHYIELTLIAQKTPLPLLRVLSFPRKHLPRAVS